VRFPDPGDFLRRRVILLPYPAGESCEENSKKRGGRIVICPKCGIGVMVYEAVATPAGAVYWRYRCPLSVCKHTFSTKQQGGQWTITGRGGLYKKPQPPMAAENGRHE